MGLSFFAEANHFDRASGPRLSTSVEILKLDDSDDARDSGNQRQSVSIGPENGLPWKRISAELVRDFDHLLVTLSSNEQPPADTKIVVAIELLPYLPVLFKHLMWLAESTNLLDPKYRHGAAE